MKKSLLFSLIFLAGFSPAFGMEKKEEQIDPNANYKQISFNVLARWILPYLKIDMDTGSTSKEFLRNHLFSYIKCIRCEALYEKLSKCKEKKFENRCSMCQKFERIKNRGSLGKALLISVQERPLFFCIIGRDYACSIGNNDIYLGTYLRYFTEEEKKRIPLGLRFKTGGMLKEIVDSEENFQSIFSTDFPKIKELNFRSYTINCIPKIVTSKNLQKNLEKIVWYRNSRDQAGADKILCEMVDKFNKFERLKRFETNICINDIESLKKLIESKKLRNGFPKLYIGKYLELNEEVCSLINKFSGLKMLKVDRREIEPEFFVAIISLENLHETLKYLSLDWVTTYPKMMNISDISDLLKKFKRLERFLIKVSSAFNVNRGAELICDICESVPTLKTVLFSRSLMIEEDGEEERVVGCISKRLKPNIVDAERNGEFNLDGPPSKKISFVFLGTQ